MNRFGALQFPKIRGRSGTRIGDPKVLPRANFLSAAKRWGKWLCRGSLIAAFAWWVPGLAAVLGIWLALVIGNELMHERASARREARPAVVPSLPGMIVICVYLFFEYGGAHGDRWWKTTVAAIVLLVAYTAFSYEWESQWTSWRKKK